MILTVLTRVTSKIYISTSLYTLPHSKTVLGFNPTWTVFMRCSVWALHVLPVPAWHEDVHARLVFIYQHKADGTKEWKTSTKKL